MAKTPTDRWVEFSSLLASFEVRLSHCDKRLVELLVDHKDDNQTVNERCKQYELIISHLKRDIEELTRWKAMLEEEQRERRKWFRSFGPNTVAAILTIILAPLSVAVWNWLMGR